jgi:hypothetical protein
VCVEFIDCGALRVIETAHDRGRKKAHYRLSKPRQRSFSRARGRAASVARESERILCPSRWAGQQRRMMWLHVKIKHVDGTTFLRSFRVFDGWVRRARPEALLLSGSFLREKLTGRLVGDALRRLRPVAVAVA